MKVTLDGYTQPVNGGDPEAIPAAYARISRSPKSVSELIEEAKSDVAAARKSNEKIVHGHGHASIAEHMVFNISIEGISRICLEKLEEHRLASYTEKSQRYTKASDFFIPDIEGASLRSRFEQFANNAMEIYAKSSLAPEDARYYLPLCALGQVGMTVNARELAHIIRGLRSLVWLPECVALADELERVSAPLAPSLLKYMQPSPFKKTWDTFQDWSCDNMDGGRVSRNLLEKYRMEPVYIPGTNHIVGYMGAEIPDHFMDFYQDINMTNLSWNDIRGYMKAIFDMKQVHDSLPDLFEHETLRFKFVMSAAAYAQLKRHRIAGMTAAPYHPAHRFTHPQEDIQARSIYFSLINQSERLHDDLWEAQAGLQTYALLNGHRRFVRWTANLRELAHFIRLRSDEHAQWDIRAFSNRIKELVIGKLAPKDLICGLDRSFMGKSELEDKLSHERDIPL